jgi:hypothetical protein
LYPSITSEVIQIFNCEQIENERRLNKDLEIECWKGNHLFWALGFGVPFIFIWTIGLPLGAFLFLFFKRKKVMDA